LGQICSKLAQLYRISVLGLSIDHLTFFNVSDRDQQPAPEMSEGGCDTQPTGFL